MVSGAGKEPLEKAMPSDWAETIDRFQQAALDSRLGIPLAYGIDAVHGNNRFYGATIFPHNIGLGATGYVSSLTPKFEILITISDFIYSYDDKTIDMKILM